jgi:uncharacterized protein (UPF0332 family)
MDEKLLDLSLHRLNKAKDDLKSAETLFEKGQFAHSMSRSYYCMFDATRAILSFDKFDSKKHSGVLSFFNRNYIKTGKIDVKFSRYLKAAQIIRLDCDYDDFYIADKKTAQLQLENAKCFLEMVEKFLEEKK